MRENTDQNNCEYGQFLRSVTITTIKYQITVSDVSMLSSKFQAMLIKTLNLITKVTP